jgi:RNA polymerase sigma factor (sigma-70 family)
MTSGEIEQLYRDHQRVLIRWLAKLVRCQDTAADLAQESYVRVAGAAKQPIANPRAFLFRTAHNVALDYLRRMRQGFRQAASLDDASEIASPIPSAERELLGKERFHLFLKSIESLPPRTREAYLQYRVYGYSYAEIAERMGISESGVEKLLMRALERHCAAIESLDREE